MCTLLGRSSLPSTASLSAYPPAFPAALASDSILPRTQGSSLICVHPTRSARAQTKAEGGGNETAPHQDTKTRSRLSIGEDAPSDPALAAAPAGRLRRPAAERHAARCASRVLCSGGAPWRYSPSREESRCHHRGGRELKRGGAKQ